MLAKRETSLPFRRSMDELEAVTRLMDTATDGKENTRHHFAPGVYLREFFLPKGMYFTSKIHKTTHLLIVAKGKTAIVSESGREIIEGPAVLTTVPGTKRAVYGIEDTTFFTVHVTEETDLEKIEDFVIARDFEEIEHKTEKLEGKK